MKFLGLEIRKANDPAIISRAEIRDTNPQGDLTSIFQNYVFRKVSGEFYEKLREAIPLIDAAIDRLISLMGTIRIIGDNMDCVKELEDFNLSVPVNDTQEGIQSWWQNMWNETLEQGFGLSEYITTPDMKDIAGLRVADSKNIIFRRNSEGKSEPWYRYPKYQNYSYTMPGYLIQQILTATYGQTVSIGGSDEMKLNPANKLYFSRNNENTDPYGSSIMRSMEWSSQILCTIENSIKNTSERFGDPMYHAHLKHKTADLEKVRKRLEDDLKVIVNAKRAGGSGDIVTATGEDGDVEIKIVGHDGQIMAYDVPLRHVKENLISKLLPAWMLGIYWSTTERMATLEVESVLQDSKVRQLLALPKLLKLYSSVLKIRGKKWNSITTSLDKPGDWGVIFEIPNLRDLVAQAQARFLNSQADLMQSGAQAANTQTSVNVGAATIDVLGHKFPLLNSPLKRGDKGVCCEKELHRPTPWPELDKVETDYENELKYDWAELQDKVFTILKLTNEKSVGAGLDPALKRVTARVTPTGQKQDPPAGIPDIEAFTFSEEQRKQIMQAMESYIGEYDYQNTNSPVRYYYGQSYSLGLIQAAKLIGKDRPILDIIKNKEIYDELCRTGFDLVKDNATRAITNKILPEMEAHMTAGSNPKDVARKLNRLFGDQNSDWERLTRSEMSMAAEKAKLNEWSAWKVKEVEFTPAPDACSICFAVKGVYKIGECPLPVADTHPRCRCSIRPAESEA
jgi:hypothetical protein